MTTNEAFEQMINTRGIFRILGLTKGTVGKMRSDMRAGLNNISLDKKIAHLQKAGYIIKQEMKWAEKGNTQHE
ncbi:hypothetical protein [Limnovirga soli]|uniref:Uncharacterized protein n=1 Tax=Limnovirga soli TaxID=2656915 RepID=A0A8J8FK66_9BACT|nr:hypothetical protein [Limnovirga soli]NNV57376.1 hypothetical protein [Limnovirga soli]